MPTKKEAVVVMWKGPVPTECDLCRDPIDGEFVDGRTMMGPWANMCRVCHRHFGKGFGIGNGQHFARQGDVWIKQA